MSPAIGSSLSVEPSAFSCFNFVKRRTAEEIYLKSSNLTFALFLQATFKVRIMIGSSRVTVGLFSPLPSTSWVCRRVSHEMDPIKLHFESRCGSTDES